MNVRGQIVIEVEDAEVFQALARIIERSSQGCWLEGEKVMTEGHTSHRFDYEVEGATPEFRETLRAGAELRTALRAFQKALGKS